MDKKERFILKNKAAFKKRYGADWERVLYSTANKMFKEEHGAGDWGTDKLTTKYLKDTPGQEDAIVKSKKVVLKKKSVEEEQPAEPKKPQADNSGYAERRAAAKKAKQDRMDRMVRARLAGGTPRKNRGAFWRQEKSVGEEVVRLNSVGSFLDTKTLMVVPQDRSGKPAEKFEDGNHLADVDAGWTKGLKGKDLNVVQNAAKRDRDAKKNIADALDEAKQGSYRQSKEDQKQREKNIQKGIDRMVQLGKDIRAGRKPKMSPAERKLRGEDVEVAESDKAEYNKLMDKYGDMPMSKVPMKARLRIRELGRSVRGDKGGPTAGDLVKSMKRRRMGEDVEVAEAVDGWIAMYNGKKVEIKKGEAKDLYAAKLKAIQMLKVPKSKQGLLAIKPAVNEDVEVAEGGMIGRTKPSRELNVQKDEKPHLAGVKSLKYQKRAAHKAERKKGKQDVKINPELDETVERAKRGVDMAKQRVLAAKQRVARAKARDLGQKRRDMRNEDSEIEEGGMSGRDFAQAGRSADYKSRVTGTQQRYAANRAKRSARATEKHSDVLRRRAIARARSRMRK